ncbi:hypothetical protein PIB30_064770 [Stylosanthes scabra]|uniref:Uncharacterized protein n=1 Tax=Stylosanthes scabra TaxID=79078 RepID=A0ABU6ZKH8_9FABA|nr:hypothetical protein [Stylosanthes scabra]
MLHIKRTARKQPMEDVVYEEPPQDHPLGKYFKTLDDLNGYMLTSRTARKFLQENKEEFMFKFKLFKKEYELDCHTLASIWNLQYLGSLFDGNHALESWGPHIKQHAYDLFNIQCQSRKKLSCSVFNTEMRVLHYILNYVLVPRAHGHGHVKDDDLVIMYAMVNEVTINWTYFIAQHMLKFKKGQSSTGFGYVCLWSCIFNHFRIDLSEEISKTLGNSSVIDNCTLHHMRRAMEDQGQEEDTRSSSSSSTTSFSRTTSRSIPTTLHA